MWPDINKETVLFCSVLRKQQFYQSFWQPLRGFFRGECVAFTTGDTCECSSIKKKTQRCTLNIFHFFIIYHLNRRNRCSSYVKNANIFLEVQGVHVLLELYANVYAS